MHEFSLAQSVQETVTSIALQQKAKSIKKVVLKFGSFALIQEDQFRFCFDIIKKESALLKDTDLEIEWIAGELRCLDCKFEGYINVDYIPVLAKAAKEKQKSEATYLAAKKLRDVVKPGDRVLIGTGWILAHYMAGETDGPPGAATLARALDLGLDARPVIITENELTEICTAACKGAGLRVFPLEKTNEIPR